ncbi:hypothetical protein Tco_0098457 [Tanacetum coccineum]
MMRVAIPSTLAPPSGTSPLLPIPLPTPSPPLLLPSTDRRVDRFEVCLPHQKRLCIAQGPIYEVEESSSAPRPTGGFRTDYGFVATLDVEIRRDPERDIGYGITNTWDEMLVGMPGAPTTDDTELVRQTTEFATMVRQDTNEIYGRLDEARDARAVIRQRLQPANSRPRSTGATCGDTETDEYTADTDDSTKMAPKRATRSTRTTTTTTTSVTKAQLKALIDQGVADALAAREADRSMNGDDNHNSSTSVRR